MPPRARTDQPPQIEEQPDEPVVIEPDAGTHLPPVRTDAPAAEPTPEPGDNEVVLAVTAGSDVFHTGRRNVPELRRTGTAVPEREADNLIALAADNGITVTKLES